MGSVAEFKFSECSERKPISLVIILMRNICLGLSVKFTSLQYLSSALEVKVLGGSKVLSEI